MSNVKSVRRGRSQNDSQIHTSIDQSLRSANNLVESMETLDGYDSDETIVDQTLDYICDDWRNGPAKRWYDMIGLPEDCQHFDYGFKLKSDNQMNNSKTNHNIDTEDSFHLVSQIKWEKSIIWDPDAVRQQILKNVRKPSIAGWIPIDDKRTAPKFIFKQTNDDNIEVLDVSPKDVNKECNKDLKCDNKTKEKTINGLSKSLRKRKPQYCDNDTEVSPNKRSHNSNEEKSAKWVSTLFEENRDLISNLWEEDVIWDPEAMTRIPEPKIIPFSGDDDNAIVEWDEEMTEDSNDSNQTSVSDNLNHLSLNISNDEFYSSVTKVDKTTTHCLLITHSIPALQLHPLCFPTWDPDFFRPILRKSRKFTSKECNVLLCDKQNKSLSSETSNNKDLSQYLIKNISELTARNGQLILMEYSEENPPLLMRVGMGSQLLNYYNKTKDKNYCPEEHRFAQTRAVCDSPFIGDIGSGRRQLSLETNMFRSPIWEHTCPETDFLIIKTENNFYIRDIDGLFVVGQQLPLMEVPRLKSPHYYGFLKQFVKMFIHLYFNGRQKVTNLDKQLFKAFPNLTKNLLTNVLRANTTKDSERFSLQSNIPFDNQINHLLTPENCCTYYSTAITAATTLKELGVGDRLFLNDEEKEKDQDKLNELAFAPWNTTVSYIGSMNAGKWLNVFDYNEDGSLVFVNQHKQKFKEYVPSIKMCKPLTNLSIKRLTLSRAHEWLLKYGMSRTSVKKYRNVIECQELIKELSQDLIANGMNTGMNKTRTIEQCYRLQCQRVFDLHSRYYSKQDYASDESEEELSEEEDESDSELEIMGQDLEAMFLQNKTLEQIEYEREEADRLELMKIIKGHKNTKDDPKTKPSFKGKILKIIRTYEMNGKTHSNEEIVRNPKVVEAYVRIRQTKSEEFIRQLSFVKNHTESGTTNNKSKNKSINSLNKSKEQTKTANGVLKTVSENLTNIRNGSTNNVKDFNQIDITDDNWELNESSVVENESLVRVDGSKLKFSKKVVLNANQIEAEEQKRIQEEKEEEERSTRISYFTPRTSNRVRIDPMVKLKDIFDGIIIEVRKRQELDENIEWFLEPIRVKDVPDYYEIIKTPMDLCTIRYRIHKGYYSSREAFLKDIKQIYENSVEYNGENDDNGITADAYKLFQFCKDKLDSMEATVAPLEQMYLRQNGTVP